jgi:hypothetical protein
MSQRNVERVIGRLVTDEQFRRRFEANAVQALQEVALAGVELTDVEMRALSGLDARTVSRFADAIDPRLQKICCRAEETSDESRTH